MVDQKCLKRIFVGKVEELDQSKKLIVDRITMSLKLRTL
jgi:hypothetical protein